MVISEKAGSFACSGSAVNLTEAINAAVEAAVSTALLAKPGSGPPMLKENLLNVKVAKEYNS